MVKATIQDVADRAGVSIKTVSRVINNEANVRDVTLGKVQRAIEELDYQPNFSARSLAGARTFRLGLLYDNHSASYLVNIQNGALRTSGAKGYDLVIQPCDFSDTQLVASIEATMRVKPVDGLILTPPLSDMSALLESLDKLGVPFALISPANRSNESRSVFTNDREACAEMTRLLASLGHRRIGFLIGDPNHGAVADRYVGYREGLKSAGLKLDRKLVTQGYNTFASGVKGAKRLLARDVRPTAIFASNDDMAAGVMRVAHELGLSIPGDLSVAGFDDIPMASQIWPSLTTIHQPMGKMAERATTLLLAQLRDSSGKEDERQPDDLHRVASSIVIRESTGPCPVEPA